MDEEKTISIKKSDLWKYSTFLLIAVLIVGGFFVFLNKGNSSGNTGTGAATGTISNADVSIFTNNPSLYPSLGPDNAKTTVIEFADFQCPVCGLASGLPSWTSQYTTQQGTGVAKTIEQMAQQGKVKFVFVTMNFLDRSSTPAGSTFAGEAGLCANEQGKFWEMHDIIFTNQVPPAQEGTQFTKTQLEIMAKSVSGLDTTKFNNCLESNKYLSAVQQSAQQASTAAQGTPTFYVNGQQIQNWPLVVSSINSA